MVESRALRDLVGLADHHEVATSHLSSPSRLSVTQERPLLTSSQLMRARVVSILPDDLSPAHLLSEETLRALEEDRVRLVEKRLAGLSLSGREARRLQRVEWQLHQDEMLRTRSDRQRVREENESLAAIARELTRMARTAR